MGIYSVSGSFYRVKDNYYYRDGTYDFYSIFWPHFAAPEMQYVNNRRIYTSDFELGPVAFGCSKAEER